jgi:hypothetical protein
MREMARKKHPKIGMHEKAAEQMSAKADMNRAKADLHSAKAREMLTRVTQVMSNSESKKGY